MAIDFGSISKYNTDRGFGFVVGTFCNSQQRVFFHIKNIKKRYPELAQKLDNGESVATVNLWYEFETTEKGQQVSKVWLEAGSIPNTYKNELSDLIQKVEDVWKDLSSPKPTWLDLVTSELIGADRRNELSAERDNLESQLRAAEEEQRRQAEEEQRRQAEAAGILRENEITRLAKKYDLTKLQAEELHRLLTDMRPLGFTHSKQLSKYIVKYKLGYKYPNISGIVTMEESGTEWDFHGGFSPEMYGIICRELKLDNQRTSARPKKFRPWEEL